LTDLFTELEPEAIRTHYWDQMDDQARRHFEAFTDLCSELDSLPSALTALSPEMPRVSTSAPVVPFGARRRVPAWVLPLTAAAAFFLGMTVPGTTVRPGTTELVPTPSHEPKTVPRFVRGTGDTEDAAARRDADHQIAMTLVERALHFLEFGMKAEALADLEEAHALNPTDISTLEHLLVVTEQLGRQEAFQEYEKRLTALEH
jgi:tetratricopeptide (TPR) repeat protein